MDNNYTDFHNSVFAMTLVALGFKETVPTYYEQFIHNTVERAQSAITTEGIVLDESSTEDVMLVAQYAAYLYDNRRKESPMPRSLRRELNNKLFSQKGSVVNG